MQLSRQLVLFLFAIVTLASCKSTAKITADNLPQTLEARVSTILLNDSTFVQSHSGLVVRELGNKKDIVNFKGDQYFTPASTTKLLTLLTCLHVLKDSVAALKYFETQDSMIIWGTGDPSFLYPFLEPNPKVTQFLSRVEKPLYFSFSNYYDQRFGSGWSWDDYKYAFQSEKSPFPMYGNLIHIVKEEGESKLNIHPKYFEEDFIVDQEQNGSLISRDENSNLIYQNPNKLNLAKRYESFVPFKTDLALTKNLMQDLLDKNIFIVDRPIAEKDLQEIKSVLADSLYKLLLQPSDNFVAEQLLLNCSSQLFDSLQVRKVIDWAKDSLLSEMPNAYQWVDGSGLSRYNLTTPQNMIFILEALAEKRSLEKLFELLPTGGESGTLKNLYAAEKPFIHAKTGSLRNNHSLAGFLIGDSGKVYSFSFMHSNFMVPSKEIKQGMDKVLRILKQTL